MIGFLFFLSIVILSQAGTLIRYAQADSLAICFWRLLIAALLLAPLAWRERAAFKRLERRDWFRLGLSGFFLFTHFYSFFRSVQETTVAVSTMLCTLSPVSTAIGAYIFFREKISLHLILACCLGLAGVAALFGENLLSLDPTHRQALEGDLWGFLSSALFSGYILTGKQIRTRLPNVAFASAIYFQTAVYAAAAMLVWQVPFSGYSTQTWTAYVALAILPTLMGHAIFTYCLNFMNVNFMSCMTLIEPMLAALAGRLLFNEKLTAFAGVAFLLTASSVVVLYWEPLVAFVRRRADA